MPNGQIPVDAILKLALDKGGADEINRFMEGHTQQWSRIERSIGNLGDTLTQHAMSLAGIAGIGALASNFINTSGAGSNVALAGGFVTGGPGTWHPYGQGLLQAQRQTGVAGTEIAQGLVTALQDAGGSPSPAQAAVLGGLLAGYGQTVGLSPAQVAQVVSPLLQAANRPLSDGGVLSAGAVLSGGLTNAPGSQSAPLLGLISQLVLQQAIGGHADLTGTTALVNAAVGTNNLWRNPQALGSAIQGVSGGLQGAYGNPSQEAFLQMAGIGYYQQRAGLNNPHTAQAIMGEATRLYGTGIARDMALRSMFGTSGADLLEGLSQHPGVISQSLHAATHPSTQHLLHQMHHAQAATTPGADINKASGGILNFLESNPLTGALGVLGILKGPGLLRGLFSRIGGGAADILGGGSEIAGLGAGATALGLAGGTVLGGEIASLISGGQVGLTHGNVLFPDSISTLHGTSGYYEQDAVKNVIAMARAKFGSHWNSMQARNWMQSKLYGDNTMDVWGARSAEDPSFNASKLRGPTGQLLDSLLGEPWATGGASTSQLDTLHQDLQKILRQLQGPAHGASYHGGTGAQNVSLLGTSAIQGMDAIAPGVELAALSGGGGGGGGYVSFGGQFASWSGGGGGSAGGGAAAGGGWQPCTLTWYDPALGGTNSSNGAANPHSATASGQPYNASSYTCAAPPAYAFGTVIAFSYGGKSIQCTVNDRGGAITGSHFDLSRGAASALGMISAGVVHAQFKVVSQGSHSTGQGSSGGGGGAGAGGATGSASHTVNVAHDAGGGGMASAARAGGHAGNGQPIHVHVYVDGQKTRARRVLTGQRI